VIEHKSTVLSTALQKFWACSIPPPPKAKKEA